MNHRVGDIYPSLHQRYERTLRSHVAPSSRSYSSRKEYGGLLASNHRVHPAKHGQSRLTLNNVGSYLPSRSRPSILQCRLRRGVLVGHQPSRFLRRYLRLLLQPQRAQSLLLRCHLQRRQAPHRGPCRHQRPVRHQSYCFSLVLLDPNLVVSYSYLP